MPLKRYADFSGRSRRKEYWMFALGVTILFVVLSLIFGGLAGAASAGAEAGGEVSSGLMGGSMIGLGLMLLLLLAIIVPSLAVQVRRFHDQDRSGWMVLLNLIPYVGGIVVLVFMCLQGTSGPNKYGPDPLESEGAVTPTTY